VADLFTGKPYTETKNANIITRSFAETVDDTDLIWHRDRSDRKITIIEGNDWYLQMDNQLPILLEKDKDYFIPKEEFHRVIKGVGPLKIRIEEF